MGTKKFATSQDNKNYATSQDKKNHATSWDKTNDATSWHNQKSRNLDNKKSRNISGQIIITQPLTTRKFTQLLTTKNQATYWDKKIFAIS